MTYELSLMDYASITYYAFLFTIGCVGLVWSLWTIRQQRKPQIRVDADDYADARRRLADYYRELDAVAKTDFRATATPEVERRIQQHCGPKGFKAGQSRRLH